MFLDGPEMVTIMGPKAARSGHNVTLRCSATSSPPSHYKWYFNNTLVANTSEYVTPPLTTDHTGVAFKCMATNYITGLNSSTYRMLTVYGETRMDIFMWLYVRVQMG